MNLPNKISCFRMLLVPIIVVFSIIPVFTQTINFEFLGVQVFFSYNQLIVLILFLVASISDFFDGYIARKYNLITSFGKFMDPIADKLLVNTLLLLFLWRGDANVIAIILMIGRDIVVDGLRLAASGQGNVMAAGMSGKVKTVLQMMAIVIILLQNFPFASFNIPMDEITLWLATLASLYSGFVYFKLNKKVILESM